MVILTVDEKKGKRWLGNYRIMLGMGDTMLAKSGYLDEFLFERYCLYTVLNKKLCIT